jgi:hypothetical protein
MIFVVRGKEQLLLLCRFVMPAEVPRLMRFAMISAAHDGRCRWMFLWLNMHPHMHRAPTAVSLVGLQTEACAQHTSYLRHSRSLASSIGKPWSAR